MQPIKFIKCECETRYEKDIFGKEVPVVVFGKWLAFHNDEIVNSKQLCKLLSITADKFVCFHHVKNDVWNVNIFNGSFTKNELRTYEFNYTAEQIAEDESKAEAEREKYFEDIERDQRAFDKEDRNF